MSTIILPSDIEIKEETKTLYIGKNGQYFLSKESAEFSLVTHFPCQCGKGIRSKIYTCCKNCTPPKQVFTKKWDGKSYLYVDDWDKYFADFQEIQEEIEEIDDPEFDKSTLTIKECKGNYLHHLDSSYWSDILCEDQEIPKEIAQKVTELNNAIDIYAQAISWSPTKFVVEHEFMD